jgi:large repetitive protein
MKNTVSQADPHKPALNIATTERPQPTNRQRPCNEKMALVLRKMASAGLMLCLLPGALTVAPDVLAEFKGDGYTVEECDASYATAKTAACTVSNVSVTGTPGPKVRQWFRGNIISNGKVYVGGSIIVGADGKITEAGCLAPSQEVLNAKADVLIDCKNAIISAGFINLHEHINYSHQQPGAPGEVMAVPVWTHRHDWRKLNKGDAGYINQGKATTAAVTQHAMLRHMLSGTTSVSGAGAMQIFARNLNLPADVVMGTPWGLAVRENTFPLFDAGTKALQAAPCVDPQLANIRINVDITSAYLAHVGEGTSTSAAAQNEIDCVLAAISEKTTPSAFVHGVAATDKQIDTMAAKGVGVVLSPRSNFRLYGASAPFKKFKDKGVLLALGTDWAPSGSLTMLDEVRCLKKHTEGIFDAAGLHRIMTENGARAVGLEGKIGKLAVGEFADLVIFDNQGIDGVEAMLVFSALKNTLAVFVGGHAVSYPSSWNASFSKMGVCEADTRDLCSQKRMVCGTAKAGDLANIVGNPEYKVNDADICELTPTTDCTAR